MRTEWHRDTTARCVRLRIRTLIFLGIKTLPVSMTIIVAALNVTT